MGTRLCIGPEDFGYVGGITITTTSNDGTDPDMTFRKLSQQATTVPIIIVKQNLKISLINSTMLFRLPVTRYPEDLGMEKSSLGQS